MPVIVNTPDDGLRRFDHATKWTVDDHGLLHVIRPASSRGHNPTLATFAAGSWTDIYLDEPKAGPFTYTPPCSG